MTEYGTLERRDDDGVLHYTRRLAHSQDKVWRAVTEPEHLAAWFPSTIEGDFVAGAPLRFVFQEPGVDPIHGEMIAFEPQSLMELRWGEDLLRLELRPDGDGTILELTDVFGVFGEFGKAARDGAGWHACLDLLEHDVDGTTPPWSSAERWREVHPAYRERFGPEASSVGPPQEWEDAHAGEVTRPR